MNTTSKGMLAMGCTTARTEAMRQTVTKLKEIQMSALIRSAINMNRLFTAGKFVNCHY